MIDPALQEQIAFGRPEDETEAVMLLQPGHDSPPGARPVARFGDVVTCRLDLSAIAAVRNHASVIALKASRVYGGTEFVAGESDGSVAAVPVRRGAWEATGRGVVLAVLDWGCDFAHPNLLREDGRTRLLALWDQRRPVRHPGHLYGYGTIHRRHEIDRALLSSDPYSALGYHPAEADVTKRGTHGCHVMDIAAGNGRRSGSLVGMAPEADLIFVHLGARNTPPLQDLGDSVRVLEAIDFVRCTAGSRPWVVNMSLGRTGGDHTGHSLVERAIDNVLEERPGRACVLSAGNYFARNLHAEGLLRPGGRAVLGWRIEPDDRTANELEVWYSGRDRCVVELVSPDGEVVAAGLDERRSVLVDGREVGRLYHRAADSASGDHHVDLFLDPGATAGRWQVVLHAVDVVDGRYHAWIERDVSRAAQSTFAPEQASPRSTIGTIANGYRTLVVGAYDPATGELGPFSSSGPTRDGRSKPDIIAPGVDILAARSTPRGLAPGDAGLVRMSGTSMAAPHVAGAAALLFEAAGRPLHIEETRALLLGAASLPEAYEPDRVGAGRLDMDKALAAAADFRNAATRLEAPGEGTTAMPTSETAIDAIDAIGHTPDSLYQEAMAGSTAGVPGLEVVALPGQRLSTPLAGGGALILLRVALGEPGLGCLATLGEGSLAGAAELAAQGVAVEDGPPGGYAVVAERGEASRPPRARRITDADGVVPPGQLLLRLRHREPAGELAEQAVTVVNPFPIHLQLPLQMGNLELTRCAEAASIQPDVNHLCGAVVDLTGDPALPPLFSHNPIDMLFVASVPKLYAMYAAFELRRRVEIQAKRMIAAGLSTAAPGWEARVFAELKTAWQPKLDAAFPAPLPSGFPKLADIFELSATGDVALAERHPPLTDAELDAIGEFGTPQGRFRDWMRLMLRWSNDEAASRCILPLSYPYINGVLGGAGFFEKSTNTGLWLSGDYRDHDWLPKDAAGQKLSPVWAKLQSREVTNFGGTAFQLARFMTLLAQGKLVDPTSSTRMIEIMTGADGIGSYIKGGLVRATPPRPFSSIASKIGFGNDRFSHDCAIVRLERGGDPARTVRYVAVVLGSPPAKARADLRKLAVGYHDCVLSRNP